MKMTQRGISGLYYRISLNLILNTMQKDGGVSFVSPFMARQMGIDMQYITRGSYDSGDEEMLSRTFAQIRTETDGGEKLSYRRCGTYLWWRCR